LKYLKTQCSKIIPTIKCTGLKFNKFAALLSPGSSSRKNSL